MKEGIPVSFIECPNYGHASKRHACKCGKCSLCGHPKHSAIHGGVMGYEGQRIVWGHQYRPSSYTPK